MAEKQLEYLYRYRSWDKNVFCVVSKPNPNAEEIEAGWGAWEWIDEKKYEEICGYISWERPCHYQAEKVLVTVMSHESFDPYAYIAQENKRMAESREEKLRPKETGFAQSMMPSSDMSLIDSYSLGNLAENVARLASNLVHGTVETVGDCASAIGDGLSDLCD